MYKFYDYQNKCWISWVPPHEKLAEDIVLEVTGKVGTKDDPVEVTEEVADKISRIYEERAPKDDPKPEDGKEPEISKAEIMLGMTSMYEEMLKKDAENKMALAEIYELELNK
ncbi:hypothetical protein AAA081_00225 [Aedoeadaptatus acetigenes]|uniref:Uncharacterized protein n=1 Tax=Aedoeadaptatus acetigenes TaxID=2981723 RepID=A0ABV1J3G1_9FIRM